MGLLRWSGPLRQVQKAIVFAAVSLNPLPASLEGACHWFQRGDVDGDGRVDIADAVRVLRFLFVGDAGAGLSCLDAADADDSGQVELADGLWILRLLFQGQTALHDPWRRLGPDFTADGLDCSEYPGGHSLSLELFEDSDAVVIVVDRSASVADDGALETMRNDILHAFCALPDGIEVGVIFFDRYFFRWPPRGAPVAVDELTREDMLGFVARFPSGIGTCFRFALEEALDMIEASPAREQAIVFASDGDSACGTLPFATEQGTLEAVRARNASRAKIHAIGMGSLSVPGKQFLRTLAAQNGGRFLELP